MSPENKVTTKKYYMVKLSLKNGFFCLFFCIVLKFRSLQAEITVVAGSGRA